MTYWHFSPQVMDQVETEITQRDQFNNDQVDISETIIREAVQNSLDAGLNREGPVQVAFKWVDATTGLDPDFFGDLFERQKEHAIASGIDMASLDFSNPSALIIEDFGTCGLTGATDRKDTDNFSDFWRRHGKSHKTGKSRGRWGLGKLVYSTTSQIGVFFGLTKRDDDPDAYLMGQTVLRLREVDGVEYPPHAFFSDLLNPEDPFSRLPVPIGDTSFIEQFRSNFSLTREEETGLSVVIPFPDPAFSVERMMSVAIGNYFYPLITGQLILQFNDTEITAENVRELAKTYAADAFAQIDLLFDFIEEINEAEKVDRQEMNISWMEDKRLDEDDFDPDVLEDIRQKFSAGEIIGLYLPVTIRNREDGKKTSGFSVYIKKPEDLVKGRDLYVRGGLTLPAEAKFGERRALGAMIAEQEDICAFLGDAENPAHTQWITRTEKLKNNYENANYSAKLVSVIKNSVVQLFDLLAEVTEEEDEDALQNFFWFDEPEAADTRKPVKPKPEPVVPDPDVPPRPPALFSVTKVNGGFTVSATEGLTEDHLPRELNVTVAYDVAKGNPFKKYNPLDFSVGRNGNIRLASKKPIQARSAAQNKWVFTVTEPDFQVTATGFDENRDLKLDIKHG